MDEMLRERARRRTEELTRFLGSDGCVDKQATVARGRDVLGTGKRTGRGAGHPRGDALGVLRSTRTCRLRYGTVKHHKGRKQHERVLEHARQAGWLPTHHPDHPAAKALHVGARHENVAVAQHTDHVGRLGVHDHDLVKQIGPVDHDIGVLENRPAALVSVQDELHDLEPVEPVL